MDLEREGGRKANQLRPISCSVGVLNRANGSASCSHGETRVLAAVYGPKAGTKKNENPEKACIEVVWKPPNRPIGKPEKEFEMVLKRTLQHICRLNVHPNTTTSIIVQVVQDDGSVSFSDFVQLFNFSKLLYLTIMTFNNGVVNTCTCAALVDAAIPLKYLSVSITCCLTESGQILLDPSKLEEQKMKAFVCLAFPSSFASVLPEESTNASGEPIEDGIITSHTHGVVPVDDYFHCVEQGRVANKTLSKILKKEMKPKSSNASMAG